MPKKSKAIKVTDVKGCKPWLKKKMSTEYAIETVNKRKRFLIVCEGQTEELYFKSFPVLSAEVKSIHQGCSKSALVDCVALYLENEVFDEIWCVFDRDIKPDVKNQNEDFNNAIHRALHNGYKCAYSNDAFELWLVLHYEFIDQQQNRTFYYDKLSKLWDINYEKHGKVRSFAKTIYNKLNQDKRASMTLASSHAKVLDTLHQSTPYHLQNPTTLAYKLVEELNKHVRR